jgi:hypothetical protein
MEATSSLKPEAALVMLTTSSSERPSERIAKVQKSSKE